MTPQDFIQKWGAPNGVPGPAYGLNEEQGAQSHFLDLCELLGVPKPSSIDGYRFEEKSKVIGGRMGYADVYLPGVFAWENKAPGKNLDTALKQLLTYSLALSNPPILVVSDQLIIRIHTQFTGHPSETHEVRISEMDLPEKRALLRRIWTAPESFKPKITNRGITEAAAKSFSTLAEGLRRRGTLGSDTTPTQTLRANQVAHFLTQCLFCFFAEDVGLLPGRMFERLVTNRNVTSDKLTLGLRDLFTAMQGGGMFGADDIPWFNGGLFKTIAVPTLTIMDMTELRNAAELNWSAIDVSIFGTLFERGLDPAKRSQLGAHYTDTATIERIIDPVLRSPLLQKWELVAQEMQWLMAKSLKKGDKNYRTAHSKFGEWLDQLKNYRVLDPACGSGNFLFLGLKALKDIEHRSHLEAAAMGMDREADLVTGPHNVLGIELNEYAAELARVTVWIGELQWRMAHGYEFKTNPVLEPLDHIQCRDALITWHGGESERNKLATPVVAVETTWPKASVVIGNPPFLGGKKFVSELGETYSNALRTVYAGRVPGLADLVSYWFEKSRAQMAMGQLSAAGLVATNSLRDGFGREVLKKINSDTPIFEAWSDETWINEGAAVRVSLIAFSPLIKSRKLNGQFVQDITADLSPIGGASTVDVTTATKIPDNLKVAFQGTTRSGPFDILGETARLWLKLPNTNGRSNADVVRPWSNGLDVTRRPSDTWIIDFGTSMSERDAAMYERPFEYCKLHVKPTRVNNRNPRLVDQWWHYDGVRVGLRKAIAPLTRYIATTITAKYRTFVWFHPSKLPDATIVAFARSDDVTFGILQSRMHEIWSLASGSWLGVGNDPRYTPGSTFETFCFPKGLSPLDTSHQRIETLPGGEVIPALLKAGELEAASAIATAAKRLNELRESWLNPAEWITRTPEVVPLGFSVSPYPDRIQPRSNLTESETRELRQRTLTNLYNKKPDWLTCAHNDLDRAVARAYGWNDFESTMSSDEILARLLRLNIARSSMSE